MSLLVVSGLRAGYGPVRVLHGIDFKVEQGEIVALLGANGAGKTTTLRALCALLPAEGEVVLAGKGLRGVSAADRVRAGLAHIPQGRGTFSDFTVHENLELGAISRSDRGTVQSDMGKWFARFPRLAERRSQRAGLLSGGEQQMLAVARALMSRPRLLLCDEPSLGLAPAITQELFALLRDLNANEGLAILLVEQNANLTLRIAHRAYVLETGLIAVSGLAKDLADDPEVRRAYMGVAA